MSEQTDLEIQEQKRLSTVDDYKFEPIKGYPMLQWKGKRPFTSTQYYPAQLKENHGEAINGWMNRIYWGDNIQVMSHLLKEFRGKVDLAYIDPPFDSNADYKKSIRLKGQSISNELSGFEEKQYGDIWTNDGYLQFIYERLVLIRELLSNVGAVYIHCDYRRSHSIKLIADEIFGTDRFVNEIVWLRTNSHNMRSKGYVRANDYILFYTKSSAFLFNEQFLGYGEAQLDRYKPDDNGRLYTGRDLTFSGANPEKQDTWRGTTPPPNRSWGSTIAQREQWWLEGRILTKRDGTPRLDGLKVYLDETKGTPLSTNWNDVSRIGNTSGERLDYPTQKPEALLERIMKVSSNPESLVFDCFMGSGTTQAVAMRLGRRFIGADINLGAVQTTAKRLIHLSKEIAQQDVQGELSSQDAMPKTLRHYTGFSVYNVNHYDIFRNPVEAKDLLLEALEIQPLPSNALYDGEKDGRMVKIMPINRIATKADINDLLTGFDYKAFQKRREAAPNKPVESLLLVCMGHEPDLGAHLKRECQGFVLDIEVVDILRDKAHLEFKRDAEAEIVVEEGMLKIVAFYPMNLLQKLSLMKENVVEWRELTESVMIDWNYDGAVFEPTILDVPDKEEFVNGKYEVPKDVGTIRVKITDLLSESLEMEVPRG